MTVTGNTPIEEVYRLHWETAQEIDRRGGRMDTYAAPHVWNLVAKILREYASTHDMRAASDLALAFARRFSEDEGFDPITWLDKCSPDPDLYPFSELWEGF